MLSQKCGGVLSSGSRQRGKGPGMEHREQCTRNQRSVAKSQSEIASEPRQHGVPWSPLILMPGHGASEDGLVAAGNQEP